MRIVLLSPYGRNKQENSIEHLIACYLRGTFPDVVQLQCDGALEICSRDIKNNALSVNRECHNCRKEQQQYADWANLKTDCLSNYLSSKDYSRSKEAILNFKSDTKIFTFDNVDLLPIIYHQIFEDLKIPVADLSKEHLSIARNFLQAAILTFRGLTNFCDKFIPDLVFCCDQNDFLTRAAVQVLKNKNIKHGIFSQDSSTEKTMVKRSIDTEIKDVDIMLPDILTIRSDITTWPSQIVDAIIEILEFLDIRDSQLTLPLARG